MEIFIAQWSLGVLRRKNRQKREVKMIFFLNTRMEAKNKATENSLFIHMLIQTFLNAMYYAPSMRI